MVLKIINLYRKLDKSLHSRLILNNLRRLMDILNLESLFQFQLYINLNFFFIISHNKLYWKNFKILKNKKKVNNTDFKKQKSQIN